MAISDFFSGGQTPDYLSGLLDDEQLQKLKAQAQKNALLQFGLSALAQGGYSQTPVGIGEILGKAGMAGMQGYQQGVQGGIEGIMTSQKLAELKKVKDRDTEMRALAKTLYKTTPAQYTQAQQPGMNVPVQVPANAQAPNFATQYQPGEVTREQIAPERQFVDTSVLGKMAALSENPLEALKTQAELVPKMRAAGMVQEATNQPNPFEMWATGAQSPSVKKLAEQYSTSFKSGMTTDPEKINKTLENLATMDEKYVGRIETQADRKAALDATNQLRRDTLTMQQQNNANMVGLRQQGLDLQRQNLMQGRTPAGYRYTTSGGLEPIPGGPADAKSQLKLAGAGDVSGMVAGLRDYYTQLGEKGSITDPSKGTIDNLIASSSSSTLGQVFGSAVGSSAQSIRNSIAQQRPLLLQAIKNATGMSAKQMDSNAELKMYLASATDPKLDLKANLDALDNIERLYGGGAFQGEKQNIIPNNEKMPATKQFNIGKTKVNATLGADGSYYVTQGGKRYKVEE
jgi:hypothetical protein